jgi:hypothetical protein
MNHFNQKNVFINTQDETSCQIVKIAIRILSERRGNECLYRLEFLSTETQRGLLRLHNAAPHIGLFQEAGNMLGNCSSLVYEANLLQVRSHIIHSLEGFADNPIASQGKLHSFFDFKR